MRTASCLVFLLSLCTFSQFASAGPQEEIEEISVTAVRRPVVAREVSFATTSEPFADRPAHLVTDHFLTTEGVSRQQTTPGQGALIVRGQKGSAVLHLVDGMRLNNAMFRNSPTQYLSLVPSGIVESVHVVRGTPSSLYGNDAIGGVVQLVTRIPEFDSEDAQPVGQVHLALNTAENLRNAGISIDFGRPSLFSNVSIERTSVGDRRVGGGERLPSSGYSSYALRYVVGGASSPQSDWYVDAHYLEQPETPRFDELYPGFGQTDPTSSEFLFAPNKRSFLHGHYAFRNGLAGFDWKLDAAWQRIDDDRVTRDFNSTERVREENRSDLFGVSAEASKSSATGSWLFGGDLYLDTVSSRRLVEDLLSGDVQSTAPRFANGARVLQVAAYGHVIRRLRDNLAASGGLRFTDVRIVFPRLVGSGTSRISNAGLGGDLGIVLDLDRHSQVFANAGIGFRAPNVFDLGALGSRPGNRYNIPNPALDEERVVQADFGFRSATEFSTFSVALFALRYRDRIASVPTGDVTPTGRIVVQSVNVAKMEAYGAEVSYEHERENWRLVAHMTYSRGTERIDTGELTPADRLPPLNGMIQINYSPTRQIDLSARVGFAARQHRLSPRDIRDPRIDPNGTPGWADVSIDLTWQVRPGWKTIVYIGNLLDRRYRIHGSGIDMPGVNLGAKMTYSWN